MGFYLCYYRAYRVPPGSPHCPDTAFTLTIKNHKNSNKADVQSKGPKPLLPPALPQRAPGIERSRVALQVNSVTALPCRRIAQHLQFNAG